MSSALGSSGYLRVTTTEDGICLHFDYGELPPDFFVDYYFIKWEKNGEKIDLTSQKKYFGVYSLKTISIRISSPNQEDKGTYCCTITGSCGSYSKCATLGKIYIITNVYRLITDCSKIILHLVYNVFLYNVQNEL